MIFIFRSNENELNPNKLRIITLDRLSTERTCLNCGSVFNKRTLYIRHRQKCCVQSEELSIVHNDESNSNDASNSSNVTEEQPKRVVLLNNEEYLEEDEVIIENYEEEFVSMNEQEPLTEEIPLQYEVKMETNSDVKPFLCSFCEKTFLSRSGRDTHQQLKHKVPNEFDQNVDDHQLEIVLETGELIRAWKCPFCELVSRRRNHHQTHLIRHAIRNKEETIKQETHEKCMVIAGTHSLSASSSAIEHDCVMLDSSPEHAEKRETATSFTTTSTPPKKDKSCDCYAVSNQSDEGSVHFSCSECGSMFHNEDDANVHILKYGSNGLCVTNVCIECNVVFVTEKLFKRHQSYHILSSISDKLNYYECLTCAVVFNCEKHLENHLKQHSTDESFQYEPVTTTLLDGYEVLIKDLDQEWNRKDLHCGYCIKFGTRNEINLHLTLFHGNLVCPFDKQDFSRSLGYFVDHMKTKHAEHFDKVVLSFTCPHCKVEEFPTKSLMTMHSKMCRAKAFPCDHCNKVFALERQLKYHLLLVNGIKNFKCTYCDKKYSNRTGLNIHTRSHTNYKPYSCSFPGCNKTFRTNSHRSAHMDTHNTNKNFECSTCLAKFQTRGSRRIHEKIHTTGMFVCEICNKEFRQRSHYVRHVNDLHHIKCSSYNLEENIRKQLKNISTIASEPSEESNE